MYLYINSNSAGMTPMTAYFSSSSRISRPMILRSPPYRICQKLWLSTTTLFAPGFCSSGENVLRFAVARQPEPSPFQSRHILEDGLPRLPVNVIRRRRFLLREAGERRLFPDHHQSLMLVKRQRPEQHGVDQTEYGRIRADAQRQSDDGYNCKAGLLQQHSRAEAQVLQQCLHKLSRGR